MNHLKKILFVLAAAAGLGLIGANSASAQVNCTALSVPTLVRAQGLTGQVGTISLNCNSAPATSSTLIQSNASITVTITPPTAVITNDLTAPNLTVVNTVVSGVAAVVGVPTISGNTLTIPLTSAGGPPATSTLGILTIGGLRVNAAASAVVFPAQIAALITTSPSNAIAVSNNQLNVAIPQSAIVFSFSAGAGLPQCSSATFAGAADVPSTIPITAIPGAGMFAPVGALTLGNKTISAAAGSTARVTVQEGFPSSFHTKADEGVGATQGTRVVITVTGFPSNMVIFAPEKVQVVATGFAGALGLTLVNSAGTDGSGGSLSGGAAGTADLITGTSITYEVTADDDSNANAVVIPIQLYATGTVSPTGTVSVSAALAPTSTITGAASGAPIPRFAVNATPASGTATTIIACVTNILFPWVANTFGYDTGFAISNTTTDPFGDTSQSGTCVYNFYGTNAPSGGTFTTSSFGGGAVISELLSKMAPGFSGYIIVQCGFQLGHGFEFISNGFGGGAVTVGQGGPGLTILQPGSGATTNRKAMASSPQVICSTSGGNGTIAAGAGTVSSVTYSCSAGFGESLGH